MGRRRYLKDKVYQFSQWLELMISIIIIVAILFYTAVLVFELKELLVGSPVDIEDLTGFINMGFGLVIGIEFIKMLCKHSPAIIVEVLIFAVARQMIVEHTTPVQNMVSIGCIAILFAIRRFLFFPYDDVEHMTFSPKEPVRKVNELMNVNLPFDNKDDTLYDVFCKYSTSEQIRKGVCVYFDGCALRVARMVKDIIVEIEVVRSQKTGIMPEK
ncbi:MAG: RNA recognition motif domain-containing protein [Anaerostipes sp.]|nr:RNA recognition motif domain-containing protein [Anaerostipes sp.]